MTIGKSAAAAVRSVRLIGGMVLMCYVAGHLANLAFGLVSLDLLDRLRSPIMAPWQTVPGQVLLYGALAAHLVLGLLAVAQRRSAASLNRSDLAQLALGFAIPLFLAWHVVRARGGIMLGADPPSYGVMLIGYWKNAPAYGLLQVLGLVAVWVHGCLGLYGWLRLHGWWPRVAPFLYPASFALPILALLGFVEAGKAALARFADPGAAWTVATRLALGKAAPVVPTMLAWRDRFLAIYAIAVAATLLVFALRALRRRGRAQLMHSGGLEIIASRGLSLLEIDRQGGIPHASACSGRARCGTCRVRVLDGITNLSPPGEAEAELLRHLHIEAADIRLACQAILVGPAVTIERLVPADLEDEAAREPHAEAVAVAAS